MSRRAPHESGLPFTLTDPLPTGTTVLEASAGTGKTHAIVALAARYIAEGVPVESLLLVTFSRMATAELRERTRERLRSLAVGLADPDGSDDDLVAVVAAVDAAELRRRRERIAGALSDFDAATVSTTHTFCSRMLDALGIAGDREEGLTLVEEVDDLVDEVVGDVYLKWFATTPPPFSSETARLIGRAGVRQSAARILPDDADADSPEALRARFVAVVRREVLRRKRMSRVRDYDELQSLLRDVVCDPVHGEAARARIRRHFRAVLVDEFQDTDPVQWEILRRCFHGHVALTLVGDPKQSIYKFRGAEVLAYLEASRVADENRRLTTNWRTDADLVAALHHLYGGAELGHREIVVRGVDARHETSRIDGVAPLRLKLLRRTGHGPMSSSSGLPSLDALRSAVVRDVADDIAALLADPPMLSTPEGDRPVRPSDIAVLVRTRKVIEPLQAALRTHGVASVVGAGVSVFTTDAARDWFHLIRALEQPTRADRVALAALTPLLGWSPAEVAASDGPPPEATDLVVDLAETVERSGFAAMVERLTLRRDLYGRVLATHDGERAMTDHLHLASLCHRHMVTERAGLAGLSRWFSERLEDPGVGDQAEQSRRLDRDAHAVTIMTVHGSKGLEFPIVHVPFGWDSAKVPKPQTLEFHDDENRRVLDVGGPDAPGYARRQTEADAEDFGEELRLFYVAVTRARSAVTLWWAPGSSARRSPLHRLLFARPGDRASGADPGPSAPIPADAEVIDALSAWAARAGVPITVSHAGSGDGPVVAEVPAGAASVTLRAARLDRTIDVGWRRTSYTALVADAHDAVHTAEPGVATEPDPLTVADEPAEDASDPDGLSPAETGSAPDDLALPSPMNGLPYGAAFGTLVHAVLESVDVDAADLRAEVHRVTVPAIAASGLDADLDRLVDALTAVMLTPLHLAEADPPGIRLADIPMRRRLAEVEFEFPLSAGDGAIEAIADLMDHHLPHDDPMRDYAPVLREIGDPELRGFLTGSIDGVLGVPVGSELRFLVVDYKTNRMGPGEASALDYDADAMTAEMIRSHYPLQAMLYAVALYRYLRWRLSDANAQDRLGPILYLFVRGMAGPQTPAGIGVVRWDLPGRLVVALSDLLGGRS
ncbi:UvrD-helicase domain-containing protein [Williamsia sp. SKLECPSW1]